MLKYKTIPRFYTSHGLRVCALRVSCKVDSLTVSNGFTLNGGNFDASASTGTFQTSSGAISLNGLALGETKSNEEKTAKECKIALG